MDTRAKRGGIREFNPNRSKGRNTSLTADQHLKCERDGEKRNTNSQKAIRTTPAKKGSFP